MMKYMFLFKLSAPAAAALVEQPSDRAAELAKTAESAGGKLEALYWMFGQYDGFAVADLPDSRAAATVSLQVARTGALAHLETHELIPGEEIPGLLESAKSVTYRAPGS